MITHIKFVNVATKNQDRALAFYTEKLGFKVVTDQPFDETQRWIELRVGGSDTRIVLFNSGQEVGGFFPGALACDNVQKTYEELKAKGVEFARPPFKDSHSDREYAILKDPDGNQLLISPR